MSTLLNKFASRSLRVRFLASLLLGAALVTTISAYATYQVAQSHIQDQLVERSKLLASAINHSAMIARSDADLQHVIEEVLKDNVDIRTIAIMSKDSERIIASAFSGQTAFSANADHNLWRQLVYAIRAGDFGFHAEINKNLVLIAPLWPKMMASDMHGEAGSQASAQSPRNPMPNMHHAMGGTPPNQGNNSDLSQPADNAKSDWITKKLSESDYRGGILLRVDRSGVIATMTNILWGMMPASIVGVLAILAITYMLLHSLVISPIDGIRRVMKRQQSGDCQARPASQSTMEFDEVAVAFEEMIDAIAEREKTIIKAKIDLKRDKELTDQNERFNAALDNISQGLCMFDGEQRLIVANERYASIYGISAELLEPGTTLRQILEYRIANGFYAGANPEAYIKERLEWVTSGISSSKTQLLSDGRSIEITHSPMTGRGWLTIHEDVTERKKSEAELISHRDHLQELVDTATKELKDKAEELKEALVKEKELNKLQREFVSMASHEFRTPLAIIDITAQRLKRRADRLTPEEAIERVDKIRDAVNRMTRLMESTLTADRMEEGKIDVKIRPCDLGRILREICARQQEMDQTHIINFELMDLPDTIQADSSALEQVLTNLLSNAVKYSPDAPEIDVVARVEGSEVVISVRDRGLGIDEEDLPRMFERFFRAKTSTGIVGTGIGLNLAKFLVEMHGGSIAIESKKGEGTTLTVRLPVDGPDGVQKSDNQAA